MPAPNGNRTGGTDAAALTGDASDTMTLEQLTQAALAGGPPVEGVTVCAHCGRPPAYIDTRHDELEAVCERCARYGAARDAGIAIAGLNALFSAVVTVAESGMALDDVLDAVRATWAADGHPDEINAHKMMLNPPGEPAWASGFLESDTRFGFDSRFVRLGEES